MGGTSQAKEAQGMKVQVSLGSVSGPAGCQGAGGGLAGVRVWLRVVQWGVCCRAQQGIWPAGNYGFLSSSLSSSSPR